MALNTGKKLLEFAENKWYPSQSDTAFSQLVKILIQHNFLVEISFGCGLFKRKVKKLN